jgi:L-alanine-DL-glutamate epimerase-like enolase superfamily enzyme
MPDSPASGQERADAGDHSAGTSNDAAATGAICETRAGPSLLMRIEHVELTFLNLPLVRRETWAWGGRSHYTVGLVELHTDEGVTGLGEVNICMGPNPDVIRAITEQLAALFVGESVFASERILARILGAGWYPFHRTAGLVLGGLEMACWDAVGKKIGQPVSALFGGAMRDSFQSMYYVQGRSDLDDMLEEAGEAVGQGFSTIYYKVGIEEERDIDLTMRMRETIGPGPKLRIDANEAWSPGTAVRILRRLAPAAIEYVEQPNLMFDIDGLAHIRRASGVAVGANQTSWGKHAILDIIKRDAADVIMTDPHQEGGLMPFKKILGLCEMAGLPFVNHAFNATTLTLLAHMHVMATSTSCVLAIQGHPNFLAEDYVTEPLDYTGGTLEVPDAPGLGVEIDPAQLARFRRAFDEDGMASIYPTAWDGPVVTIPRL